MKNIIVVCVESENEGNLGAIARAMTNFDLQELLLLNPKVNHLHEDALRRAKHAGHILKHARVQHGSINEVDADYLVGSTAMLGRDYNILRSPVSPKQLADNISPLAKTALIFGRDGAGLTNNEIRQCDFVVTVPTAPAYETLNISHATAILFYELYQVLGNEKINQHILPATAKEKKLIMENIGSIIKNMNFPTKEKEETQRIVWKKIIGKSYLSKREAFAVLGFLRKLEKKINQTRSIEYSPSHLSRYNISL